MNGISRRQRQGAGRVAAKNEGVAGNKKRAGELRVSRSYSKPPQEIEGPTVGVASGRC